MYSYIIIINKFTNRLKCSRLRLFFVFAFLFAVNSRCSETEFTCLNGECLSSASLVCDGNVTCEDRSDEMSCGKSVHLDVSDDRFPLRFLRMLSYASCGRNGLH